jgi:predicted nucleic acid-binding protein
VRRFLLDASVALRVVLGHSPAAAVQLIPISDAVLAQAEAIVPHIRSLDAIHLASLIHTGIDATVATHDETMARVAELLGYPVIDPVARG